MNNTLRDSEKNLLKILIYYIIKNHKEKTFENLLNLLEYKKNVIENLVNECHSYIIDFYFSKIRGISDTDYELVIRELKPKIKQEEMTGKFFPLLSNELEVDIFAEKITNNNSNKLMQTLKDYEKELLAQEDGRALFIEGKRLIANLKDGSSSESKINYQLGKKYLEKSVKSQCSYAIYYLGTMYYFGIKGLVKKDYKRAEEYLREFINKEEKNENMKFYLEQSKEVLGKIYYCGGYNLPMDKKMALKLFNEINEKNYDKYILLYIGSMYLEGEVCEKNIELGIEYLEKSAEQDNVEAQMKLIQIYIDGLDGIEGDKKKGLYWLKRAVNNNSKDAKYLLGLVYYYGDNDMEIKSNSKYGMELLKEASDAGVYYARQEIEKIQKEVGVYNEPDIRDYKYDKRKKRNNWFDS